MRKVIYDVVEPLTKKQFLSFEGVNEMKKLLALQEAKNAETVQKLERNIKKCDALDYHEKRLRDIENEIIMIKGLQRNENANILERVETLS
jgi:hypothetical protein